MRFLQLLVLAAIVSTPLAARAGDPCPISFWLVPMPPFPWSEAGVKPEDDEVFAALRAYLNEQECTETMVQIPADGRIEFGPDDTPAFEKVQLALVNEKKAYRCKNAHRVLEKRPELKKARQEVSGLVIYQRGRRRVLLTAVGWDTICLPLTELGKVPDDAVLKKLWDGATERLVQDRHNNP